MYPSPVQRCDLFEQCRHARYVWNLALEQWSMWRRDRGPAPTFTEQCRQLTEARAASVRLKSLQRRLARCRSGSARRRKVKAAVAKLFARARNRRKDWVEKTSTELARRFDVIRVEDLRIVQLTRRPKPKPDPERPDVYLPNRRRAKAGLNRAVLANGWGGLVRRLQDKGPGRVEKVHPAYTSQTCSDCGHCAPENRESCEDDGVLSRTAV
ncbi:transposase [Kribbella sp. VKM Ac-2571]|uniref:RNA-guided endonuclease InsQ/TnpB family protein n=1 Tax=Kribbella sp. VKM Ac-2571 TaxID=2512222 RepID=UPI001EDD4F50|nr:transposase [Kribbella sp. VKM Ac-2571]